jgi:hypothetical protein
MVVRQMDRWHGTRAACAAVAGLLLVLSAGCSSPILEEVAALRSDAVAAAVAAGRNDMTAFSIKDPGVIGTISGTDVAVTVPTGTDLTSLVAIFTITGATVTVNGVAQTSNVTINDFTSPVSYLVTASDGTTKVYTVTISIGVTAPILSATAAAASITTITAASGGTISNNGGAIITASGICWSPTQNPTVESCLGKTTNGPVSAGSWGNSSMTSLSAGTTYYVRAYATNAKGTGYGAQVSFTTLSYVSTASTLTTVGGTAGSGKLTVSWTAATGATSYDVYYNTTNAFASASLSPDGTSVTGLSCTLTGLVNYTQTYHVWVVARNATGPGPASTSSFSTVGVPVTGITLQRQADTQSIPGGRTADAFVYESRDTLVATLATADGKDPTNPTVTWTTTSSTYAAVAGSGLSCLVTAGSAAGSATVTATANDGQGASVGCAITVTSNAVGQNGPGGGKIIYDQGSYTVGGSSAATYGWRYLETTVYSSSLTGSWGQWHSPSMSLSLSDSVGEGPGNTMKLIAGFTEFNLYGFSTSLACHIAHIYQDGTTNGKLSDWFLPSKGEMDTANWRTYAAVPSWYGAWSSSGLSDCSQGSFYSNGAYNNGNAGWIYVTANENKSVTRVYPMRRF